MSSTIRHIARLKARHGIAITITRGEQSCQLVAVPGQSKATIVGDNGAFQTVIVSDWLILVSEWTLTGPAEPRKGDKITIDDSEAIYFVAHPDDKTPVFRNFNPLDRPAKAWRVHSIPR